MNPAPSDPAEILLRVRQQLILAQVRIMELEDAQEESRSQLADNERLVDAAQSLADQKLDEAAHAEKTRADLQAQFSQLQHLVQETNAALAAAQSELTASRQKLEALLREAAAREQRLGELDQELRNVKSTRSWRWTAWLRALGPSRSGRKS
jgi:chromosome segregation ATPase